MGKLQRYHHWHAFLKSKDVPVDLDGDQPAEIENLVFDRFDLFSDSVKTVDYVYIGFATVINEEELPLCEASPLDLAPCETACIVPTVQLLHFEDLQRR